VSDPRGLTGMIPIARGWAERHQCERLMLGKTFGVDGITYRVCLVNHRKGAGHAHAHSIAGPVGDGPALWIKGIPTNDLATLVGCSCGHHRLGFVGFSV